MQACAPRLAELRLINQRLECRRSGLFSLSAQERPPFVVYNIAVEVSVMRNLLKRISPCHAILCLALPLSSICFAQQSSESAKLDAEREKIWNSKEMLEARAYLDLYFKRSAKITPEQAEEYMADLRAKSPEQMQIWLIQHQEQRSQVQQEQARWTNLRREAARGNLPAQNVGNFRNPLASRATVSSGRPVDARPNANTLTQRPIQKPFSGPQFSGAAQPLVTSEDVARYEILRGLGPFNIF